MSWSPSRTLEECERLICAEGGPHELQIQLIDGCALRVYKTLWPSLRTFWLWSASEYKDRPYLVFEKQRYSYSQVLERAAKAASIYRDVFGIQKGDRVGICSRNYPEYMVAFWATHLLGAVTVLVNAWLPADTLAYCIVKTTCKLLIVDAQRADLLDSLAPSLTRDAGTQGFIVIESHEGKGGWKKFKPWETIYEAFRGDTKRVLSDTINITLDDNATIFFTSGTTGRPKGVLSTQRNFLTNILNTLVGGRRAALRRGEDMPVISPDDPQRAALLSVPFFHVTGLTSLTMMSTMLGMKIVLMRNWVPETASKLIKAENIVVAGGVPSMVADLTDSSAQGQPLEALMFGGAPAPEILIPKAKKAFPDAAMGQGYGLTETNALAVGFVGEDYAARPGSTGLPTPINDILIMDRQDIGCPAGVVGEIWLRGPNIMKGYWEDEEATNKVLTKDGWFKTGDIGYLDKEGFLYIKDRIKDIIIRGGENIDSITVENALYDIEGVVEAAAVGVPDQRLGELVAAVVSVKPGNPMNLTEKSLIATVGKRLPRFAVPVMVIIQDHSFELTASGKIQKMALRQLARDEWQRRIKAKL